MNMKKLFDKNRAIWSAVMGFLISIAFILGYQLETYGATAAGFAGKGKILLFSALLMIPVGAVVYLLYLAAEKWCVIRPAKTKAKSVFFVSFLLIVISRIPAFLAYYPAVMSYDFGRQISEASKGHIWFFDYQPLIHTEVIRIFYLIGLKIGSLETGMALLSVFQILVVSAILAYSVSLIYRITGRIVFSYAQTAVYALLPLHELMAVVMTKDVFFAAFFLLFICLLYERSRKASIPLDVAIVLTAILNIMFRKNSVYAMVFLIIGYLIYEKLLINKARSAILIIVCIVAGLVCQNAMLTGFNAIRGNNREMYSVPMMQFMRVFVNQNPVLTREQVEMLVKVLPLEMEGISYDPYVADSVKNYSGYRNEIWGGSPKAFAHEWIEIGKAYPNEFIDAFLFLNKGYWYLPDRMFAEAFGVGAENGKGLIHTYNHTYEVLPDGGIKDTCYFPAARSYYETVINENGFFDWPVLNLLFRPAFYFWLLMLITAYAFARQRRIGWMVISYPLVYMATLFFGPLVYIRYMYPLILSVPVLFALVVFETKETEEKQEE